MIFAVMGFLCGIIGSCLVFFLLWQKHRQHKANILAEKNLIANEKQNLLSTNQTLHKNEEKLRKESLDLQIQNSQREKEIEMLKTHFDEKIHEKEQTLKDQTNQWEETQQKQLSENHLLQQKEKQWVKDLASLKAENERLQKEAESRETHWQEKTQEKEKHFRELEERNQQLTKKAKTDFENTARKIIQENTKSHREEASKSISFLLQPFKEDMEHFKKSLQDISGKEKFLNDTIKTFKDINSKMRDEAKELSFVLKGDVKVQGQWGEFVLTNILEKSGLRKGEEFFLQAQGLDIKDEKGAPLKPDVVVKLPDNKHIVIDSKVSLTHYQEWLCSSSEEKRRELEMKMSYSLSNHIDNLASKKYSFSTTLYSPDFTLMFIPNETVFGLATKAKKDLFEKAWAQSIVPVGPTTLFAVLKTIASIWKMERQSQNAEEIARQGGLLYDKFVGFLDDMNKVGDSLKKAEDSYDSAMGKLKTGKGNIVQKTHQLKNLGVRNRKELPASF